jgi:hypothetical protein
MLRYQALGNYFFMGGDLEELARAYWKNQYGAPQERTDLSFGDWMAERADWSKRWDGSVIRTDSVRHFMEDLEARGHIRPIPDGHIVVLCSDGKLFVACDTGGGTGPPPTIDLSDYLKKPVLAAPGGSGVPSAAPDDNIPLDIFGGRTALLGMPTTWVPITAMDGTVVYVPGY